MARMPKDKALARLEESLDKIPKLKDNASDLFLFEDSDYQEWYVSTKRRIERIFDYKPEYVDLFEDSLEQKFMESRVIILARVESLLRSMAEDIEDTWDDPVQSEILSNPSNTAFPLSNKIFVIHGHDRAVQQTAARFLEKLGLEPVILHEQPNGGRTIIEKFEDYADVGYAVVLLTPDDTGASKRKPDEIRDRARQNVVLELGYFLGKLGRNRVCALVKGDIEKPSDLDGVVYVPLDEGDGWQLRLVRELKDADFAVDANQAL